MVCYLHGDDGIVPIAWAVVNKDNKLNWRWFLFWLRQELQLEEGSNITIVSDMQKVYKLISFMYCNYTLFIKINYVLLHFVWLNRCSQCSFTQGRTHMVC